jgi:hypothetical protein
MQDRSLIGTVLVAGSAVAYSSAGFFTRLIDLDTATLWFWRGLFAGLFMWTVLGPRQLFSTSRANISCSWQGGLPRTMPDGRA